MKYLLGTAKHSLHSAFEKHCPSMAVLFIITLLLTLSAAGCSDRDRERHGSRSPANPAEIISLTVNPDNASLTVGTSLQLSAAASYRDGSEQDVTEEAEWSVSDPEIAVVEGGLVTALASGSVTVTAAVSGCSGSAEVQAADAASMDYVVMSSSGLVEDGITLIKGIGEPLHVYVNLDDGSSIEVTDSVVWNSSEPEVADVSAEGVVEPKSPGQTVITAELEDGEIAARFTVTVADAKLTAIALDKTELNIIAGYSDMLSAAAAYDNGESHNIDALASWSSSDGSVAQVERDADGTVKVIGKKQGTAVITAACEGQSAQCSVTVAEAKLVSLSFDQGSEIQLAKGLTAEISVTGGFSDGSAHNITREAVFDSDNKEAAAVEDAEGSGEARLLRALSPGKAVITAEKDGVSAVLQVEVSAAVVTGLTLTGADSVIAGDTITLSASAALSDGSVVEGVEPEKWESADPSTAMVTEGLVTGRKPGKVNITAKLGSVESEPKEITVNNAVVRTLKIESDTASVLVGRNLTLGVVAGYSDGSESSDVSPSWRSEQESIATVVDGVVTGRKAGTAVITASLDGAEDSLEITVYKELTGFTVTAPGTEVKTGQTIKLKATALFNDDTESDVSADDGCVWTSSEPAKATVTKGTVKGLQPADSVVITAKYAGFEKTVTLAVVRNTVQVTVDNLLAFDYETDEMVLNEGNVLYKLGCYDSVVPDRWGRCGELYKNGVKVTSLEIPATGEKDGTYYVIVGIGDSAFEGCAGLKSVVVPNGVTSIGDSAFKENEDLESVTIPNSVTSIGDNVFEGCRSLQEAAVPNSITAIADGTFKDCEGLRSVTIPNSVTSIGKDAFENCRSLRELIIPDSISSIGEGAFSYTGLETAEIPEGITSIPSNCFAGCSELQTVTIPDSVTAIEYCGFGWCSSLSMDIPENITSIGAYAFTDCDGLTSVTIPAGVTKIERWAFSNCNYLRSAAIPGSVTAIEESAFLACTRLESISIPDGVISIGEEAFFNCEKLSSVSIASSVTAIGKKAFGHDRYSACPADSITVPDGVTSIGEKAFFDVKHIYYGGEATWESGDERWGAKAMN